MANQKSDKPFVRNWAIGCSLAIIVFHFAWAKQYFANLHNLFFLIVDFGLVALFIWQASDAYRLADDPDKDWKRKLFIGLTIASCIWAAGWSAGLNERVGL